MTDNAPEREQQRLAQYYASAPDGELENLADEWEQLSEAARTALGEELTRRGYDLDPEPKPRISTPDLEKLVAVRFFRDLPEALLAKGTLDSAGITSRLRDENMVRMNWFISNVLGNVKLLVHPEDVQESERLLSAPTPPSIALGSNEEYEQPRCPRCHSVEVRYQELNKPVTYIVMWILAPIPVFQRKWTCETCGAQWQEVPD